MATTNRRSREGFPATAPKFFKIILEPESDTLRIPKVFTRSHGQNLRKRVFLKVPEGSVMEAELIQSSSNGETWLRNGWVEFKERYSIGFGYLLVFTYNGNSQFDVLIFDTTASEISYPVGRTQSAKSDDDDDAILENVEVSRNPLAEKQRKRRNNSTIEFLPSKSIPDTSLKLDESSTSGFRKGSSIHSLKAKGVAKETCVAYQKALAYKSCISANKSNTTSQQKPFFISLIQPSYVSHKFYLNVPVSFAKPSLLSVGANNLQLMMNGRKWHVMCRVRRGFKKAKLSSGWKKFAQDNGLKVGDCCIFEARKRAALVWDVIVF